MSGSGSRTPSRGSSTHTTPRTASRSKTQLPKTSPVPMSGALEKSTAMSEIESSGRQLPAAISVAPASAFGIRSTPHISSSAST